MKSVQIWTFFWSECGKIRTKKNNVFEHFSRSVGDVSSIENNDDRISIDGYNLIRADHPSYSKRSAVCICYKEHIPLIKRDGICTLHNCLMTEFCSQSEKCFLMIRICHESVTIPLIIIFEES